MTCVTRATEEITISGDLSVPGMYGKNNEYLVSVNDNGYVRAGLYIATPVRVTVWAHQQASSRCDGVQDEKKQTTFKLFRNREQYGVKRQQTLDEADRHSGACALLQLVYRLMTVRHAVLLADGLDACDTCHCRGHRCQG